MRTEAKTRVVSHPGDGSFVRLLGSDPRRVAVLFSSTTNTVQVRPGTGSEELAIPLLGNQVQSFLRCDWHSLVTGEWYYSNTVTNVVFVAEVIELPANRIGDKNVSGDSQIDGDKSGFEPLGFG